MVGLLQRMNEVMAQQDSFYYFSAYTNMIQVFKSKLGKDQALLVCLMDKCVVLKVRWHLAMTLWTSRLGWCCPLVAVCHATWLQGTGTRWQQHRKKLLRQVQ